MTRFISPILPILAGLAGCIDAATDDQLPDGVSALAPDPSMVATSGWCWGSYVWNGTSARIYWPSNGGCGSTVYSPMVVMLPGFGFTPADYQYLMAHLAKNGYIGVTVDAIPNGTTDAAYGAAADKAWAFVHDFVWTTWSKRFFIDPDNIGLIGHSRGGETIRYLAEDLAGDPIFHVRDAVALAPTEYHAIALDAGNTDAALVMVGSLDEDVTPASAYQVHDRASSEASQLDPLNNPAVIDRSMKLIENATHGWFAVDSSFGDMVKGYVLAELHAHLKADYSYFDDYVRGDAVPSGWTSSVTTQYSDGGLRRVIDNFEDGTTGTSTIGGGVTVTIGAGGVLDLGASAASPHDTWALRYTPPASGGGFSWSIPVGKRDESAYKYLSVRVGQTAGPVTDDLRVRIVNHGVTSAWVRFTDHGQLAQHMTMCLDHGCGSSGDQGQMGTIRIPLDAFGTHTDVTSIEIGATSEATDGEFYLDNLELSESVGGP